MPKKFPELNEKGLESHVIVRFSLPKEVSKTCTGPTAGRGNLKLPLDPPALMLRAFTNSKERCDENFCDGSFCGASVCRLALILLFVIPPSSGALNRADSL